MSIVTPIPQNTVIKVYAGIPWDDTLRDVRLFDTSAQRDIYFNGKLKGIWEKCSIVSIGKSIKVEGYYNNFLECNYLTFTNQVPDTTARTIYAFITSISYVNVNTVQIDYTIDWIQTYLFDFEFDECLVEREHVNDDVQGRYVLEEGVDFGEYQVDNQIYFDFEPAIILNVLPKNIAATIKDNMYIPGLTSVHRINNTTEIQLLNDILENYTENPERITSIFMGVGQMKGNFESGSTLFYEAMTATEERTFNPSAGGSGSGAYTPQNQKMLCYPYKLVTGDNYCGSLHQYRWESFNTPGTAEFVVEGSALPKPSMQFFPINYRKVASTGTQRNTYEQEGLFYENFPSVNYATDTFKAWVSQYGMSFVVETAAKVGVGVAGMAASIGAGNTMGAIGAGMGVVNAATEAYQTIRDHDIHSSQMHGGVSVSGLAYAREAIGFRVTEYSISVEDAMRIDHYLTRYGYRVEKVKVPNVRGRQFVNYVKTNGAIVSGNVAVDAKVQMERALDQGVSFWHTDAVGAPLTSNPIV